MGLRPGPPTLRGGLKDRAGPAAQVLDPASPALRVLRCTAMALSLVCSHTHPHLLRRRWIGGSSTRFLLALSEACCSQSLPRLGELVDQELFDRQSAAPALPLNPKLEKLVPF